MKTRTLFATFALLAGFSVLGGACAATQTPAGHLEPCERPSNEPCVGKLVCDYDFARACQICRCVSPKGPDDVHTPPLIAKTPSSSK